MPTHSVQTPEWIDTAPLRFSNSATIAASPATVWSFIADHEAWPSWFTSLDKVEVTGAPTGVGGRRRVTVKRLGIDEEFTAWADNEQFGFALVKTPFPFIDSFAEDVQLDTDGDGCRITYRQGISAKKGFGWLAKLAFGSLDAQTAEALAVLKTNCEL